jgi:hypothetical protein
MHLLLPSSKIILLMFRFLILLVILLPIHVFSQQKLSPKDLRALQSRMTGSFSSEAQSARDSQFLHIVLHMAPIWKNTSDGFWLYVEQSLASSQDKPYRQRVYHVTLSSDSTIASQVFELKAPLRFAGAWKEKKPLASLTADSLIRRDGCVILLRKNTEGDFAGSTNARDCPSNLRGAAYATSEVMIRKDRMISWDRGWDSNDHQVWGAEKEGYEFVKVK